MASKTQIAGEIDLIGKKVFIQVSRTLKLIELVEISHAPANFFYFVNQCYWSLDPYISRLDNLFNLFDTFMDVQRWEDNQMPYGFWPRDKFFFKSLKANIFSMKKIIINCWSALTLFISLSQSEGTELSLIH